MGRTYEDMVSGDHLDPTSASEDPLVGKLLDRYRILGLIARGGMGRVYRAHQENLERVVALKTLDAQAGGDEDEFRQRFSLEASLCAKLSHPNTVRIFDYGTTDEGVCYIAMEFLEGRSLHQVIKEEAPFEPLRAIRLVKQICGSLAEAHDQQIVHRDLKPGNIILTCHGEEGEFPKVLDFGLVKALNQETEVTQAGALLGSPMYMSPEQVQNEPVDPRTDVYSLGVILFIMLTGEPPFGRSNAMTMLMSHLTAEVPRFAEVAPDVTLPDCLEWVVRVCMRKAKEDRFASMRELARALKACEMELSGEVEEPLQLELDDGYVVLPEWMDDPSVTGMLVSSAAFGPARPSGSALGPSEPPTLVEAGSPPGTSQATPIPGEPGSGPQRRPASPLVVVLLVFLGILVVGGMVSVSTMLAVRSASGPDRDVPEPEDVVPMVVEPEAPVVPALREVLVRTVPEGAQVEREGVFLGDAPVTVRVKEGTLVTLRVSAVGYQPREITVDGGQPEVPVSLRETPEPASRPAPVVTPPPEPADEAESTATEKPAGTWGSSTEVRDPWADP
ncbi:MAG: protein kinase [Deltaproteobacteria bacterium]|nr:protein kinase [Deltaproteobacteria bacterium]